MEPSTTAEVKKVVDQIIKGLRSGVVNSGLRKAASNYARLCSDANRRLQRCVSLLQQNSEDEYTVLMQAMRSPDLRDLATRLSASTLTGWREFCRQHGLAAAQPIDDKALAKLSSLYTRVGGAGGAVAGSATGRVAGDAPPGAAAEMDRRGERDTSATPVVAATGGGGRTGGPAIIAAGPSGRGQGQRQRKGKGGGGKQLLLIFGMLLLIAGVAVVALLPGMRARTENARLSAELNVLFEQGSWEEAGALIENHRERLSKHGSRPPLSESLAVWNLAAELREVGANVHRFPGYQGFESPAMAIEAIGRDASESGIHIDRHSGLAGLIERNEAQQSDWNLFLAGLDEAWTAQERLEPNAFGSRDEMAELLAGFAPGPADHGEQLLRRLERVAEQAESFEALRQQAADSSPDQDAELRQQSGKISARVLSMADGADSTVSRIIVAMAAEIGRFEPHSARVQAPTTVAEARPSMPVQVPPSATPNPPQPSPPPAEPQPSQPANQPPVVSTEGNTGPPSAAAFALPPTFLVMWNQSHIYRIDPGSSGIRLFDASLAAFVSEPPELASEAQSGAADWVAIVGDGIRETLNGSPVFTRKRDGDKMVLRGRGAASHDSTFLIRFTADRDKGVPDYQVIVYRPLEQNYVFRLPAAGLVERAAGQAQMLQLAPPLVMAMRPLSLPDKGARGRLLLRLETGSGAVRGEPVEFQNGAFPLAQLRLDLAGAGGAADRLRQVEEQIDQLTKMKDAKAAFEAGVAQGGGADQLFRGMGSFEVERSSSSRYSSSASLSFEPVAGELLPIGNLDLFVSDRGASGVRPPMVDYVQHLVTHLLETDGKLLQLGGTNSPDRQTLASLQRIRIVGGWRKKDDFDVLRKQWQAVTDHAVKRSKLEPGYQPGAPPSQQDDESADKYVNRLNTLQRRVNTDLLFDNWARLFASDEMDRFWPWLAGGGKTSDFGSRLKTLEDQRAALGKQAEVTKKLQDSSLETLGKYFIDCEIATDGQPVQVIRLIQLEGAAPAVSVPRKVSAIAQK